MILMLLLGLGGLLGWGVLGAWAQDPGIRFSDPHNPRPPGIWDEEVEDTSGDPSGRNWCPYQKSRLVTFTAACKTEKFLVHSQQPCPQGAPDCQRVKVMYRVANKPVYQVKQKVLFSVAWRCCPGFKGPDCQHRDPTVTPETAESSGGLQEPWDQPVSFELGHSATELSEVRRQQEQQEGLLRDLQNDVHQAAEGLPGPWRAPARNLTAAMTQANQTGLELLDGRFLEQVLPPADTFLQEHFSSLWKSFNESLHSLSQAVRNLSLDVEANRQAIKRVKEDVARTDFQEFGAKFEAKVQENSQKVEQLRQEVEDRLHIQRDSLHHALSEVQADVDAKLKRLLKAQQPWGANGSLAMASAARPEPESLQARLGQLHRNLSALHMATSRREEELQNTLEDMRATLDQHTAEIKELYSESDETFHQISKVELQVEELQVNQTTLRQLRVMLMEKSLIMEEIKEELERQLLELKLTLQHLQDRHADLLNYFKDCNCQKLYIDLDIIREGQRDTTRALEKTKVRLDEWRQLEGSSLQALRSAVDSVSLAVTAQGEEDERARAERARLRTQLRALDSAVEMLRAATMETRGQTLQLRDNFASLLEDALRHEAVLAALFGEEKMEEMAEETSGPLPLQYEQIRTSLQDATSWLQEQALGWDALTARVEALEEAVGGHAETAGPAERKETSHDLGREEQRAAGLAGLKQELQHLSSHIKGISQCCEASWASSFNGSLEDLHSALSATERGLEQHRQLFYSLFGNFQGLVAANVSLDLNKLQAMLSRKDKKQRKDLEAPQKRYKKQVALLADAHAQALDHNILDPDLWEAGSPVAFYASYSEETANPDTVKFNSASANVGSSYFPEHGYFQAPERGVYLFAVSIEFGPGPGMGQLVFGGHHWTPVYSTEQKGGGTATTIAMAELQKGEKVWFKLMKGSVAKGSPTGTAFGGLLLFRT